jgi:hypothetical protein
MLSCVVAPIETRDGVRRPLLGPLSQHLHCDSVLS